MPVDNEACPLPANATPPESTYHVHRDDIDTSELSILVIEALGEAIGIDPVSNRIPINRCIDPDALDNLFGECSDGTRGSHGSVSFQIWEIPITVHTDGRVFVYPLED